MKRPRRFSFTLRMMFAAVALLVLALGWGINKSRVAAARREALICVAERALIRYTPYQWQSIPSWAFDDIQVRVIDIVGDISADEARTLQHAFPEALILKRQYEEIFGDSKPMHRITVSPP